VRLLALTLTRGAAPPARGIQPRDPPPRGTDVPSSLRSALAALGIALAIAGCGDDDDDDSAPEECPGIGTIVDEPITPTWTCPGDPDCPDEGDDVLWAGASAVTITPTIVERMTVDVDGDHFYDEDDDEFDDVDGDGKFDGVFIAGLGSPRPAESILRDTWARAVALRQNETTIVFVALDLIGWFHDEIVEMREALPEALEVDYLVVSATHCHECPDVVGLWGVDDVTSGVDPEYVDYVVQRGVQAATEAVEALAPAHITYGAIPTNDYPDWGSANYVGDSRDPVIIDDVLRVLQLRAAEGGATIATLVNWASHPEYSGDDHQMVSPDYPAWLCDGVEQGIDLGSTQREGFGGVCVFINGAIGGQIGPNDVGLIGLDGVQHEEDSPSSAEATGWSVAEYVHRAVEQGETEDTARLSFVATEFYVPVLNHSFQTAFLIDLIEREAYNYDPSELLDEGNYPELLSEQAVVRIGRATAVTLPGELFPELAIGGYDGSHTPPYWEIFHEEGNTAPPDLTKAPCGPYIAEQMDGDYQLYLGLTQDFLGYIVPRYDFVLDAGLPYFEEPDEGDHYEETRSLGPHAAQMFMGNLQTLLKVAPP
jgi:hypothetical protein